MKKILFLFLALSNYALAASIKSNTVRISVKAVPVYQSLLAAAQDLRPGEWYQLPAKNKMSDVYPPQDGGNWYASRYSPQNVVNAWGGGAVAEGKLFIWGGGHNDYGGNEVYLFDLDTWTWSRATNPSNYVTYPCSLPSNPCVTVDNTPVSVHSYNGITYIPTLARMWVGGGADYSTGGGFGNQSALFNFTTKTWTMLPKIPRAGSVFSAWDEVSGKVLIITGEGSEGSGTFFTYNPTTNAYGNISGPNWSVSNAADFDPINRKFVFAGATRANSVYVYNFSGIDLKTNTSVDWHRFDYQITRMNGQDFKPELASGTGFIYCPDRKLFVAWDGKSSDVWTLDPLTWEWKRNIAINQGPPNGNTRGVYGRWRYLSEYKIFIGYDNINSDPWIYKLP